MPSRLVVPNKGATIALASWADYQQTGQHLTDGRARGWLRGWGSEEDTGAPACHGTIVTAGVVAGLGRCRQFLLKKDRAAARAGVPCMLVLEI